MTSLAYKTPDKHPEEDKRERAVARSGVLTLVQRQALTPILNVVRNELGIGAAGITIVHQETATMIAAAGFPVGVYDRATSFCAHAILQQEDLMVVPDARRDERFLGNPFVRNGDGILFYASMLLVDDDKMPLGTLCVFGAEPREGLTNTEVGCLRRVSQAITALLRRHACAGVA